MALELKVAPVEMHAVHELAGHELICELRKTNMVLYGMFVELVRQFYRYQTPYVVGVPDIRWDPDPRKTGIWIDSELNWNPSHPEFVPAIYVKLGGVQYGGVTGEGRPSYGISTLKDALYASTRSARSQVTFVHVGGTAGEACMLCDNTRAYLSDFSAQVRRDLAFAGFYEQSATPIAQCEPDSREKWQSASTFALEWYERSVVKFESPILRAVDIVPCAPGLGPVPQSGAGGENNALLDSVNFGILSSRQGEPDHHTGDQR